MRWNRASLANAPFQMKSRGGLTELLPLTYKVLIALQKKVPKPNFSKERKINWCSVVSKALMTPLIFKLWMEFILDGYFSRSAAPPPATSSWTLQRLPLLFVDIIRLICSGVLIEVLYPPLRLHRGVSDKTKTFYL